MTKRYVRGHKPRAGPFGTCVDCFEALDEVIASWWGTESDGVTHEAPEYGTPRTTYYRHAPRPKPMRDRDRRFCSKCGKPGEWYTFKPGSGECVDCQT